MDKNERDVQNALGQMKEYTVKIRVPIKGTVTIYKRVMAPTEEDAVDNVKTILEMTPPRDVEAEITEAMHSAYTARITIGEADTCEVIDSTKNIFSSEGPMNSMTVEDVLTHSNMTAKEDSSKADCDRRDQGFSTSASA